MTLFVAAALVTLTAGAISLAGDRVRPSPSPSQSATPSPSLTATPTESPSASQLPALQMPGMNPNNPAGEYGWTGVVGSSAWMHNVVGHGEIEMVFAIKYHCFAGGEGSEPVPVTVAGLEGWYVERTVLGHTTGAWALPFDDRSLCVYLTGNALTTPEELDAARKVVGSIRSQAYEGGIRINFTLSQGWDRG